MFVNFCHLATLQEKLLQLSSIKLSEQTADGPLWRHAIKFLRWQHPAVGDERRLLSIASLVDIVFRRRYLKHNVTCFCVSVITI